MTCINDNFNNIKNIISQCNSYESIMKSLLQKDLIYNSKIIINTLFNCQDKLLFSNARLFLTVWMINQYPEQFFEKKDYVNEELYKLANDICISNDIQQKKNTIEEYLIEFKKWKQKDKEKLENHLIENYYNLQHNIDSIIGEKHIELIKDNKEYMDFILLNKKQQTKLKDELIKLSGPNILQKLKDYNYTAPISIFSKISETVEKAYWDKIDLDLSNNNYDTLKALLVDIKNMLNYIYSRNEKKKEELTEFFDIDFIINQLAGKSLSVDQIVQQITYLYNILTELQAPADDKPNKEWFDNLFKKSEESMGKFIVDFFKGYINKIIMIYKITKELRESG